MGAFTSEWLVTDQKGAFAMGTADGYRTRKYHGLLLGIAGRQETAYLVDLDVEADGKAIWPHCYRGAEGCFFHPCLDDIAMKFNAKNHYPLWQWSLQRGKLSLSLEPQRTGGFALIWSWTSKTQPFLHLKIRGFWAMRDLHGIGGVKWNYREGIIETDQNRNAYSTWVGNWKWIRDPKWYRNFHYTEEVERGYDANENLYSDGYSEIQLQTNSSAGWIIQIENVDHEGKIDSIPYSRQKGDDFVLTEPAGIVAGFPWFGEWGRDTFISLPGLLAAKLQEGEDPDQLWKWAKEILNRWGDWISHHGMLPNVLEKNGQSQWESSDATLWWCHSLATLWAYSLCAPFPFESIQKDFSGQLDHALLSIKNGRHHFLSIHPDGLLEVTGDHSTWMDARIRGVAVTPRCGLLPEVNSLYFQARCLQWIWSENKEFSEIENLGEKIFQHCQEPNRPNQIFMHSLTLAPSFILKKWNLLEQDLIQIAEKFWTPVGLRTLSPHHPLFKARCVGTQNQRDLAYHQGPVWGWLGGHFEIARHRLAACLSGSTPAGKVRVQTPFEHSRYDKMFIPGVLKDMPIEGHIPEIFDAEPPFTPRGAPAQAWSLACLEESKAHKRSKIDSKITKILAQRWLGREERKSKHTRTNPIEKNPIEKKMMGDRH